MKTTIIIISFIISVLITEGCAMSLDDQNITNDANFQFSEGFILKEKALDLAKQYCIGKGFDFLIIKKMRLINKSDSHYKVIPKELLETDWIFIAPTTLKVRIFQGLEWGIIYVNRKNGKVVYGGEGPS